MRWSHLVEGIIVIGRMILLYIVNLLLFYLSNALLIRNKYILILKVTIIVIYLTRVIFHAGLLFIGEIVLGTTNLVLCKLRSADFGVVDGLLWTEDAATTSLNITVRCLINHRVFKVLRHHFFSSTVFELLVGAQPCKVLLSMRWIWIRRHVI